MNPMQAPFIFLAGLVFFVLLIGLFFLVQIGLVTIAFSKLGLTAGQAFLILLATLLGSGVNIPVFKTSRLVRTPEDFRLQGWRTRGGRPFFRMGRMGHARRFGGSNAHGNGHGNDWSHPGDALGHEEGVELRPQIIAINVGGCVIPCLLSALFISQVGLTPALLMCFSAVTLACRFLSKPIAGVGVAIPLLAPAVVAALSTMLFNRDPDAVAQIAYVSGCLGTLAGADLLRLLDPRSRRELDAPLLSIGGAGTFDGVFLSGLIAVLLA